VDWKEVRTVALLFTAPYAGSVPSLWAQWGDNISMEFFTAVAAIIPVLLLALMIELANAFGADRMTASIERDQREHETLRQEALALAANDPERRAAWAARFDELDRHLRRHRKQRVAISQRVRWGARAFFFHAIVAEAFALVALATQDSSSFQAAVVVNNMLALGFILWFAYEDRYEDRGS
jgi:hypothetical protein